jgi:hypothetical protein
MSARFLPAFASASLLLLSAPAAIAAPDNCDTGSPGFVLDMPVMAAVGATVTVAMEGPAHAAGRFLASLGEGPIKLKGFWLCLDAPFLVDVPFFFDAGGKYSFEDVLPEDPSLIGIVVYSQFLTFKPDSGTSKQTSLEIVAGLAPGDFVTYDQKELGVNCEGFGGPACILEQWFDVLFPNGLILGDQDGPDGDTEYCVVFTSPRAIAKFLPDTGPVGPLTGDLVDPLETPAGELVAQLLVARLNYALDQAGAYDALKLRDPLKIGDLLFAKNVNRDLFGWEVGAVVDVIDLALSGALGEGDLDLDGDGELDAYLTDLSDALSELNQNFKSGGIDLGSLKYR